MMVACSFKILVCVALFTLHTHTVSVSAEAEAEAEADQVGIHTDAEADVIPASFFSKVQNFWWASGNGRGLKKRKMSNKKKGKSSKNKKGKGHKAKKNDRSKSREDCDHHDHHAASVEDPYQMKIMENSVDRVRLEVVKDEMYSTMTKGMIEFLSFGKTYTFDIHQDIPLSVRQARKISARYAFYAYPVHSDAHCKETNGHGNEEHKLLRHRRLDNPGCDDVIDTACDLNCCATHDRCYDVNDCSAESWLLTGLTCLFGCAPTPCDGCNTAVTACIAEQESEAVCSDQFMIDKCYDNQDDYFFDCPGDFYCSALSDDDICCDCASDKRINNRPV